MKRYENWYIIITTCYCFLASCSPIDRFARLVEKHPYLLETLETDTIVVRESLPQDTQVVWKTNIDTFVYQNLKIERIHDTFRFFYRERNCTTHINKTEIKPSKIIEKTLQAKQERPIYKILTLVLLLLLVLLFLFK